MQLFISRIFILPLLLVFMLLPATSYSADIQGLWLTRNGESIVNVAPCSQGICGQLIWLAEDAGGSRVTKDKKNKDRNLRKQPLVGLNLLSFVNPQGKNNWSGRIYNPGDGNTYTAKLMLKDNNTLEVSGCALAGLICKEQDWYRISQNGGGINGEWILGDGKVMADVKECGNELCANAIWVRPGQDRSVIGMSLLENMKKSGSSWKGDAIHPFEKKRYPSTIEQINGNMVQLEACLGGLVCQKLFWHRAAR